MTLNCFEQFVDKHLDKPWDWRMYGLSRNPSITQEFVDKHLDKPWNWGKGGLSSNTFKKSIEENAAAITIQRGCHNWLWKPKCNDGTLGINVRLSLKDLGIK